MPNRNECGLAAAAQSPSWENRQLRTCAHLNRFLAPGAAKNGKKKGDAAL